MNKHIQKAIQILKKGGIAIFPTDTIFGIGCRLDNQEALKKLFKIRNRPEEKAVLAVVDSLEMAKKYVYIPRKVQSQLIDTFWPGPLTIVLPCKTKKVPPLARGGGKTLGVRQTNHPILLELIKAVGAPLVAPSANFAGEKSPKIFSDIDPKLIALVDFALDIPSGGQQASTVVDCSHRQWKILREGAVKVSI